MLTIFSQPLRSANNFPTLRTTINRAELVMAANELRKIDWLNSANVLALVNANFKLQIKAKPSIRKPNEVFKFNGHVWITRLGTMPTKAKFFRTSCETFSFGNEEFSILSIWFFAFEEWMKWNEINGESRSRRTVQWDTPMKTNSYKARGSVYYYGK